MLTKLYREGGIVSLNSIISHRDKFIYVPMPGISDDGIVKSISQVTKSSRVDYIDNDYIESPGYFTFTFVKHPLNKLCEYYMDNILNDVNQIQLGRDELSKRANHMSFEDFILYISEISPKELRMELQPAYSIPEVEFVGKFENFQDDFKTVSQTIGREYYGTWCKDYCTNDIYQDFFTSEIFELIKSHYQKDLDRFNYFYES